MNDIVSHVTLELTNHKSDSYYTAALELKYKLLKISQKITLINSTLVDGICQTVSRIYTPLRLQQKLLLYY